MPERRQRHFSKTGKRHRGSKENYTKLQHRRNVVNDLKRDTGVEHVYWAESDPGCKVEVVNVEEEQDYYDNNNHDNDDNDGNNEEVIPSSDQKINPNTTRRSHDASYYLDKWIQAANKKIADEREYSNYPKGDPNFEEHNPKIINEKEVENSIINPDRKSSEHYSSKIISVPNVLKPRGGKTRKYKKLKKTKPKSTKKAKKTSKRRQTKKRSSHK